MGPGFAEKVYHNAIKMVFDEQNIKYGTEKEYKVFFQNKQIGTLRVDLVVEDKAILEIKALAGYIPQICKYQVVSYLKVSKLPVGLLVNFGNKSCQVKRIIN